MKKLSLTQKIIFSATALCLLVVSAFTSAIFYRQYKTSIKNTDANITASVELLIEASMGYLWNFDNKALEKLAEGAKNDSELDFFFRQHWEGNF